MENIRDILAKNIKDNRRRCGLSQERLAEAAKLSPQYIAMIEISRKFPTPDVLDRISESLGVKTHQLFAVPPSPEDAVVRLRQDIKSDMKELFDEYDVLDRIAKALGVEPQQLFSAPPFLEDAIVRLRQDIKSDVKELINEYDVLSRRAKSLGLETHQLFAVPPFLEEVIVRLRQDIKNDMKELFDEYVGKKQGKVKSKRKK
jgi:transcriptional regulator with XRE-family HTH domain